MEAKRVVQPLSREDLGEHEGTGRFLMDDDSCGYLHGLHAQST